MLSCVFSGTVFELLKVPFLLVNNCVKTKMKTNKKLKKPYKHPNPQMATA